MEDDREDSLISKHFNWYYFDDHYFDSLSINSAAPIPAEEDARHSRKRIRLILPRKKSPELEAAPPSLHYCKQCNRSFTSGKALGGHVSSVHSQSNKVYSDKKQLSGTVAEAGIKCKECGKGFWTEKSLYGHMRKHPERPFRGMEPPPPPSPVAASSSSAGIGSMSWPRGTKRGRGPLGAIGRREDAFVGNEVSKKLERLRKLGQDWYDGVNELLLLPTRGIPHATCTCDVCNEGFLTRHALGGHKSSHSDDKSRVKEKKNWNIGKVSSSDDYDDKNVRSNEVVVGFDINMMPDEDEDENENESN